MEEEDSPGVAAVCSLLAIQSKEEVPVPGALRAAGFDGLRDRSRASLNRSSAIGQELVELIIQSWL